MGCELNVCENHLDKSNRDDGYQMIFLAKNKNGFRNISKLSSIANIDGFYSVSYTHLTLPTILLV